MNTIKVIVNGVSSIVQKEQENLWKIVHSEVPNISGNRSRLLLSDVCQLLTARMDDFNAILTQFKEIDMYVCLTTFLFIYLFI